MMKITIPTKEEYDSLIKIEAKIGKKTLSKEEVETMRKEAGKGAPHWEFTWGLIELFEFNNEKAALEWFEKTLRHMNGFGLLRCSGILAGLGDEWIDLSMRYLRRAAWRQNPIAKRMLKYMKDYPFHHPQA